MFFHFIGVLCCLVNPTFSQVTVQFVDTAVLVDEGAQFSLKVRKSGPVTNTIHFVVEVERNADFIGNSQVGSFYPGGPDTSSVTFTVLDDTIPEIEETFTFSLDVKTSGVIKGSENIAVVTIRANDDAYGVFGFVDQSPQLVVEDIVTTVVNLRIGREKGNNGRVAVSYLVNSSNPDAVPGVDITPSNGTILFQPGETINYLQLQIRADNIPENNEEFTITLTGADKGARVDSTEVLLIIQANDAPIRFQLAEYRFDEGPGDKTVYIQVLRGIDMDGETRIGSVSSVATVDYVVVPDTASSGIDFRVQNNQVVFDTSGQTQQAIPIIIVDDSSPEVEERFQIILSEPKGDVIRANPYRITVVINANDNPFGVISFQPSQQISPPTIIINEDGQTTALFTVLRRGGTFGTVSVAWEVYRNDSVVGDVRGDLVQSGGILAFQAGQSQAEINITVIKDTISEPVERFVVRLLPTSVSGGAKVEGITDGILLIQDSDNYYGIVEFGTQNEQRIISSPPRRLSLTLKRQGYNQDAVKCNVSVSYNGPGDNGVIVETPELEVVFQSGQNSRIVLIPILSSAFLQVGGQFSAVISSAVLVTEPPLGAYNTPKLGNKTSVTVPVTINEANGEIGFHSTNPMLTSEPESVPYQVQLKLTREGTSGRASISWSLSGSVTSTDVAQSSGTVFMEEGKSESMLIITILPDNIPEVDEEFTVTLTSVSPSDTQRLKQGADKIKITIAENDNPGGTFQFSGSMKDSYLVKEGLDTIDIIVERLGGDLVTRWVQYSVVPDGSTEFYGATNVLRFDPGVRVRNSTLLAKADGIPEIKESYNISLQSYSNISASIGPRSVIRVDVEENDSPYGVIQFEDSAVYYMNESKGGITNFLSILVMREMGRFGTVTVLWGITPSSGNDLVPVSGSITFGEGQDKGFIRVETVADDVPEPPETFVIELTQPGGGAQLNMTANRATVVINQNDNPLYFKDLVIYAKEPSVVNATLKLDGDIKERVTVKYHTVDGSALARNADYSPIISQEVIFNVGDKEKNISVTILEDTLPEGNETFFIRVFQAEGDVVLTQQPNVSVTILANDDAYGVFLFNAPYERVVEEGSVATYEIGRNQGRHGEVEVFWEIQDPITNQPLNEGGDFLIVNGSVIFKETEFYKYISVSPRADSAPEEDKMFNIVLKEVVVLKGLSDGNLAKLSDTNTAVKLKVLASDDPYGHFVFDINSKERSIAEDYYPGQEQSAKATFIVERRQGVLGKVMISWEIFSHQVATTLPKIYDLIFLSEISDSIKGNSSLRRPGTGTDVLDLKGADDQFVTVPSNHHPPGNEIQDGFSLSAWVQPFSSSVSGYIVAKTTNDGSRYLYTLKLITGPSSAILLFGFSQTGTTSNTQISVSYNGILHDRNWHHILLVVATGTVTFYVDGLVIGSRSIGSQPMIDVSGKLLIGAIAPNKERFVGLIQDVQIFSRQLQGSEIAAIFTIPSSRDVTPISGYLSYIQGERTRSITISSVPDNIEEDDELFTVRLLSAKYGATISQIDNTAKLTVLKSDYANGFFGFLGKCTPDRAVTEATNTTCVVDRQRGDEGTVNITWGVFQITDNGPVDAMDDFVNRKGIVSFAAKEKTKSFIVQVRDDQIPEVMETFEIRLVSVATVGGSGTTNISGASIDPLRASSSFVIDGNDFPNGLLQFSTSSNPPTSSDVPLPVATSQPQIKKSEESGVVSILVVRAQGTAGEVSVEWRTVDGTAKSAGKVPLDYAAGAGKLTFQNGQLYSYINIAIIDNQIPEGEKTFTVVLVNPTGGATTGIGSTITVVIDTSDGAFGVFQFEDSSLNVVAQELGDSGYNSVFLNVLRLQGDIGVIGVTWKVLGNPGNDIIDTNGTVVFPHGVTRASIEIKIRGDTEPELNEMYQVQLTGTQQGNLGLTSKLTANLTIMANDNPYGVFIMPDNLRPLQVDEGNKNVTLTIQRLYGKHGTVAVSYRTLSPTETYPYMPASVRRASTADFKPVTGTVQFLTDETTKEIVIQIYDDFEPENDESVFIQLTNVTVLSQSLNTSVSAIIGPASQSYAQVIIRSNDNANGALELSPLSTSVSESSGSAGIGVNVVRKGGSFGQVSVTFQVINGTAYENLDFVVLSNRVILLDGETSKPISVQIINDLIPELTEVFYIKLLDPVEGGAVLGSSIDTVVKIEPSDDPFGAFDFAVNGVSNEEPETVNPSFINITIIRTGGTLGVVSLYWEAKLNGGFPVADISPTSGYVHFVSNDASQNILVAILPDNIPEGQEDITFRLVNVSGGGRLGSRTEFTLTILPNDNPHGVVVLSNTNFTVEEKDTNDVQYIALTRIGGLYGQLRVYFSTVQIDIIQEASQGGNTVLSYFNAPSGGSRGVTGNSIDVSTVSNPAEICGSACLRTQACVAFEVFLSQTVNSLNTCMWYTTSATQPLISSPTHRYYTKNTEKVTELFGRRALAGQDYGAVSNGYVLLNEGFTTGSIPLSILADSIPELDEKFEVHLLRVEVASPGASSKYPPSLGNVTKATVTILKNDNAFGMFTIFSDSLSAVNNGHVTSVEEKPQLAVDLIVERQGGSLGTVTVDWYINVTASSAIYGKDYLGDGATLQFVPGQTRRLITITVLDDIVPEENKTVMVQLRNPQGGAEVANDANVKVIILENDNVAGILGFDTTSVLATEGDKIFINVTRKKSALGTVTVDWNIQGMNGLNPQLGFETFQGSFQFLPGVVSKTVSLVVLKDDKPEVNEEYRIHLTNIQTQGIGPTGAAIIDPMFQTATITIQGSDNPHGVIQFAADSLNVRQDEKNIIIQLNIVRMFGSVGKLRVTYEIRNGSVSPLTEDLLGATMNQDFVATNNFIDIPNSVLSAPVSVQIRDDDLPEVDEAFIVTLTGVTLMDSSGSSMPPSLGQTGTTAQVIINANDGTKGVAIFTSDSVSVTVDEISKNITLAVFRDKGTFGNVSVFYYAQSLNQGATPGVDFKLTPQDLHFAKGEDRKLIYIEILNDDNAPEPEPDESFQVILSNPRNGLELGTPSRATVTILRNDGASGIVSFETADIVMVDEAGADNSSGTVQLKVVRGPGIFGVVNVPFEVVPDFPQNNNDLSPSKGFITLQDRQSSAFIELKALDDDIPEQIERFTVRILPPDNEATLGNIRQKTVIINPNDSPNGLLQIYARGTTNNTISVDENVGMLMFDIRRTQGSDGRITVDMATRPGTAAVNSDLTDVTLAPIQIIPANQVKAWYSYVRNQTMYMVMLTTFRVGDLTSGVGSNGSASAINVDRLYDSTLFKWQGELIPIQTIETDNGVSATSFIIDGMTYLVVANKGNLRRYQTKSRLYKVNNNGGLLVLQDLQSSGVEEVEYFSQGNDHFVVFANSKDNNAETVVNVDIYKWDNTTKLFTPSPWQSLGNLGCQAVEVFVIEGVTYMAVANNYNSQLKTFQVDSVIYKLGSDLRFAEHQRIRTFGAVDVKYLLLQSLHLIVFANNRGDTISSPQLSTVYRWDSTTQMFFKQVDIKTNRVESIEAFVGTDNTGHLAIANGIGDSGIYSWNLQEQKFDQVWSGPPALHMYPVLIQQTTGPLVVMAIASKQATDNATIYQFVKLKNSDFSPRTITMMFEPGERLRHTSVVVLQDDVPENTEDFYITLSNPTGGAEIGTQNKITVNILSNDNAHGIIEIAPDSLELRVTEEDGRDNKVQINVVRKKGFFGRIVVKWVATGDHNGLNDITPLEGMVEFADGQSVATISLTILNDKLAELPEVTYVRLTEIMESGTTLPGRGAQIGPNNVATLIVQANDSPYGVVLWEKGQVIVSEPNGTDYTQVLYIVREQGKMGQLHVTYQTDRDNSKPIANQAVSGADYVARQGLVVIQENVTRAPVEIVIKQDLVPEGDESFIVNITGVTLSGLTPPPGAEPSIKIPGNIVAITITENDNARGIVQFNVTTNVEGRVDSYEEYGKNTSIKLRVSRTVGFLGAVTVTWQAEPREATVLDFTPSSGTIRLEDGMSSADIVITILDDTIPEEMETFDVKLLSVTGGSQLGPANFVKVAILKNDSPNGLFRFVQTEVTIKESTTLSDPQGVASLDIERLQGTEGVVNVQWRLNAEAAYDFVEPLTETVLFSQGENKRTITLRTKPDTILEGQERFIVSLITADNNADISHTRGDAVVIISPDPGASGTISILPQYRQLQIGEPGESSPSYNGQVKIVLTRGLGIYGNIDVTWSLTPRETTQFLQIEGTVNFVDLQQTATITLQAQDDTKPERPMIFTLQLNSATNGATISQVPGSYVSEILFVASDYPHGLFEFTLPQITNVTEDMSIVTIPVIRRFGRDKQVLVFYTTTAGTATSYQDFLPVTSNLMFQHGDQQQVIRIRITDDDIPEGPEIFYVNLTSTRLVVPGNTTKINGLQIDMDPAIGPVNYKVVNIYKNDNAEGTVEFDPTAVQFTVIEESGMAKIPLIRKGGNYGQVTVKFSVQNSTAMEGLDYVVPKREVVLADGDRNATIDIVIRDDNIMEFEERFIIRLVEILGGAKFGDLTTSTVTIAKSDFPNGKFGFMGEKLQKTVPNPDRQARKETLSIERTGGVTGQQKLFWRILGPNNPKQVLIETNDINFISGNTKVTSGSLTWNDQEAGVKTFDLYLEPYTTWEIEKMFVIQIFEIQGSPQGVGDGEIGPKTGNFTITISKFGHPNGIILFNGIALTERIVDEPEAGIMKLRFPVIRRFDTGTVGSVQVFWEIEGPVSAAPDFQPRNGSVVIGDELWSADIEISILADDVPELTESFKMVLRRVDGGAEFDKNNTISYFKIRYNDFPHGQFGIIPKYQSIIVKPADLGRHVRLNFTRHDGTFGAVLLTFNIKYDVPQSNIIINNTVGTVKFDAAMTNVVLELGILGDGFLAMDSTFTVTLIDVQYLGQGVTMPPRFKLGETETKVIVPAVAANSEVGFKSDLVSVDEVTRTSLITVVRRGTYGTLDVSWKSGFPSNPPAGYQAGKITPGLGTLTVANGIESRNFTVELSALADTKEYFALHLPKAPSTTARGGTRLMTGKDVLKIEPFGVFRFASNSTNPTVSELEGKIYLKVDRYYGSEGKVEVTYRSQEISATKHSDYFTLETNAVVMEPGQTSGLILVQVVQDTNPEEEEKFYINLTHVEKYPTELVPKNSPRLSTTFSHSVVTIAESNDPYGVLCLEPVYMSVEELHKSINLTIERTGGVYGTVSVIVRTVGGGEPWTSQIAINPASTGNDTITQILSNRDPRNAATGGQDYEVLDTKVIFQQGEERKSVTVKTLSDSMAEHEESVIVYLTQPTGGARIAAGSLDGGKRGFSIITIEQNDLSNGIIGFAEKSKSVIVNEDTSPTFTLELSRINTIQNGQVEVSWIAKKRKDSSLSEDGELFEQLQKTAGTAICPKDKSSCYFNVTLNNDQKPEGEFTFVIKLESVRRDAQLDLQSLYANITIEPSDYYRGLFQFTRDTRMIVVSDKELQAAVKVERQKGIGFDVDITIETMQMTNRVTDGSITVNPALETEDFTKKIQTLSFKANQAVNMETVNIRLTPASKSISPYPKQFYIQMKNPTNGASIHPDITYSQAVIRIVEERSLPIWKIILDKGSIKNDSDILKTLADLNTITGKDDGLSEEETDLIEDILNEVIEEGQKRELPNQIINQALSVLCKMLNPNKNDATRGRSSLADVMEKLAYASLFGKNCPSPQPPEVLRFQCAYAKMSAGRWLLDDLQNFKYQKNGQAQKLDTFTVPQSIPNVPIPTKGDCQDFHLIEYSSEQWFMRSDQTELLNNKVIGFGIKGKQSSRIEKPAQFRIYTSDRRIATRRAQCVYYDMSIKDWVGGSNGVCQVNNNLELGVDDYVDCSCYHMTHYGVKATSLDPGLVGYSVWFYIACFVCMICMALAIMVHHICASLYTMFSANLLMHMCFACFATQLCYVIAAYLSPNEILVYQLGQDNYRCIVMGLFLHYFFLTQFTWIMAQSINFWKILVMNDEHTDRKYVLFFLIGWGLPVVLLAIFYVVTFNLYKYVYSLPVDFIYGDVNNNQEMCFITNPYAALGGILIPVLLMLVLVVIVFVKAFQVTPQWQAYDDIYRGRYNIDEIRTLLLFWAVISLTWLWGGLHLVYGQLWMLILFCIFDIIQGIMALVLYCILRNPCLQQCFGPGKKMYSITGDLTSLPPEHHHHHLHHSVENGSIKESRVGTMIENWEGDSTIPSKSTMKVKRTLPSSGNIYVTPPVLIRTPETEDTDKDFDDLLFMLKGNGSYTASDANSLLDSDKLSEVSSKIDKYEMRRISIADTHL